MYLTAQLINLLDYYSAPALRNANNFWLKNPKLKGSDQKFQTFPTLKETQLAGSRHLDKIAEKAAPYSWGKLWGGGRVGGDSYSDLEGSSEGHKNKDELGHDNAAVAERKSV